jgi:hypothetical protein
MSTASGLGLAVDDFVVLSDSNRVVVRLTPCDVVARITPTDYRVFAAAVGTEGELELVRRLTESGGPVAALEPRVEPRVYSDDGFDLTFMTYHEPATLRLPPADYTAALQRLHVAMRPLDVDAPHFTDRAADVERWVARPDVTPDLADEDRELFIDVIGNLKKSIVARRFEEQLLHGEPHPWNILDTTNGLLFIDLENCVRGPVEFDLGWAPTEVSAHYPDVDHDLVNECRGLVLTIVAAHAWRHGDERPGKDARAGLLGIIRNGEPWPAL